MSKPLEEILSLSQFQSTVEIHWDLIIAGESVGSAVCFKNPWCQSLIFLGETLISCIVPGNHGLFSGQQKNPAQNAPPLSSGTTVGTHTHWREASHVGLHISLGLKLPLCCDRVCLVFRIIFYYKMSVGDERQRVKTGQEHKCWPLVGGFKTLGPDFWGLLTHRAVSGVIKTQHRWLTG